MVLASGGTSSTARGAMISTTIYFRRRRMEDHVYAWVLLIRSAGPRIVLTRLPRTPRKGGTQCEDANRRSRHLSILESRVVGEYCATLPSTPAIHADRDGVGPCSSYCASPQEMIRCSCPKRKPHFLRREHPGPGPGRSSLWGKEVFRFGKIRFGAIATIKLSCRGSQCCRCPYPRMI